MFARLVSNEAGRGPPAVAEVAGGAGAAEDGARSPRTRPTERPQKSPRSAAGPGLPDEDPAGLPGGIPSSIAVAEKFADGITAGRMEFATPTPEGEEFDDVQVVDQHKDIKVATLDELRLQTNVINDTKRAWETFCSAGESREAAGEAIYSALFEGAPSLQSLFTTPRGVQAMRFLTSLDSFIQALGLPAQLKVLVESLGFSHLNLEVTVPRVAIFRDCILDLFAVELGDRFTPEAREGWKAMLNYCGGAIIFVKSHYADRLSILSESWAQARGVEGQEGQLMAAVAAAKKKQQAREQTSGELNSGQAMQKGASGADVKTRGFKFWKRPGQAWESTGEPGANSVRSGGGEDPMQSPRGEASGELDGDRKGGKSQTAAATTYNEMFHFNLAVMGLQKSQKWLLEILGSFDTIVTNITNSARLQQECNVLALKLSKCTNGGDEKINLGEYKSCMLSSMRGVLAKVWDSSYEVAWNWLWDNVERMLKRTLGSPAKWQVALKGMMDSWTEDDVFDIRKQIYEHFFAAAPIGQDYFKQSNTRLHYIANRVLEMTGEMYADPWKMVDHLSALGLRHVGYAIPTELFGPYVTACIQVITNVTQDQTTIEAFRWSLGLISNMLVGTINEGSTIVMKAINVNSVKMLKKAVSCAPRGRRSQWLLLVQVGTQSISPLSWALQSGSMDTAAAIIEDLLTIRADRERYYYGMEELFERHPDIFKILCAESTALLFTLLDGLVWRSRLTSNGMRHANYYVKYLIVDKDGNFSDALSHLCGTANPEVMSHKVLNVVSDQLWDTIVCWNFVRARIWFVLSLIFFMLGQAILPKVGEPEHLPVWLRGCVFACRLLNYIFTMFRLIYQHSRDIYQSYRDGEVKRVLRVPIPMYLLEAHEGGLFVLGVFFTVMFVTEPMFYCLGDSQWPTEDCDASENVVFRYSLVAMWAMILHWILLVDLAVFSTGLSAFALVCVHVASEIGRFLIALVFVLLTFASAISVLEHSYKDMRNVSGCTVALFAITLQIYEDDYRDFQEDSILLAMVFLFITASAILLLNLLIAQLNCSYVYVYKNMFGFARLRRAEVIVEQLSENCSEKQWRRVVATFGLDVQMEFNAGDIGIAGGMSVEEPANAFTVTHDKVIRYGGSCSPEAQWPEESGEAEEVGDDKFERMERLIQRTLKKLSQSGGSARARASKKSTSSGPTSSGVNTSGDPGRQSSSTGSDSDSCASSQ
eukprot:CAMPEP_0203930556 /NCGR_PEP_ID=MMETSP0359-20131031/69271_1 /ASSEMBLY_ACC=CAM_ASM_000338 /TAXON_ID=268821 /ORGANISM="Scrippsiella Hangoei, Strain SHTV-5" /LENGTH=1214 /DNA_ID=CAMNT_0050859743 /DNA_START=103 /DNA_END=3744 /DNA_ORIENTATION=+